MTLVSALDVTRGRTAREPGSAGRYVGRMDALPGVVVDVHAHALAAAVQGLVAGQPGLADEASRLARTFGPKSTARNRDLAAGEWAVPLTDTPTRLRLMDEAGVDVQVVSVIPTQFYYWAEAGLAADIAAAANEHIAALARSQPGRLAGLATVSLQHPRLAAEQLEQAMSRLGLRGAEISTAAAGRDFSDPYFEPFWEAAEHLGAFVLIHPYGCTLEDRLSPFYLGNVIGNPAETTLALSHLIFGGVLDRHPGLRICAAHGGGYLPYYAGRSDHAWEVRPESRTTARPPSAYLRDLYYDALVYRADTLAHLVGAVGAGRVLLGTDYPFDMGVTDPLDRLAVAGLGDADRAAIAGGTAAALLGIPATRDGAAVPAAG
jgi:aminocarboxymuconate-semialdehyde decarboxylase